MTKTLLATPEEEPERGRPGLSAPELWAALRQAMLGPEPPPKVACTFVLARTYRDYLSWCRKTGLRPNGREVRHLTSARQLRGFRDIRVVYLPEWWYNKGWKATEITQAIKVVKVTGGTVIEEEGEP